MKDKKCEKCGNPIEGKPFFDKEEKRVLCKFCAEPLMDWKKPTTEDVLDCFSEQRPERYFLIERRAKKKGFDPFEFNRIFLEIAEKGSEFRKKGIILEPKKNRFVREG